jgi:hypothetical protein
VFFLQLTNDIWCVISLARFHTFPEEMETSDCSFPQCLPTILSTLLWIKTLCPDHKRNVFSFSKSSKTNLKTHISTAHSDDVKKIQEEEKKTNPFLLCSLSSEEQSRITDAVVDFVIEADEPIALPEKPAFRKLMKR